MGPQAATPEAVLALTRALEEDRNGAVRQAAAGALGAMGAQAARPEVVAALVRALRDRSSRVRQAAAEALGSMGAAAARPEVTAALVRAVRKNEVPWVRWAAARALGRLAPYGGAEAVEVAREVLREALRELEARMARAVLAGQEPDGQDRSVWEAVRKALAALGTGREEKP